MERLHRPRAGLRRIERAHGGAGVVSIHAQGAAEHLAERDIADRDRASINRFGTAPSCSKAVDAANGNLYAAWQDVRFNAIEAVAFSPRGRRKLVVLPLPSGRGIGGG